MKNLWLFAGFIFAFVACENSAQKSGNESFSVETSTDANGYTFEYVTNDPMEARIYTLENGLKVYLTVNKDKPRIQTLIPVKAGSTYDPKDNTGLAHYLEHMVFKGTERIGTLDWEKEAPLIEQISDLYEEHKAATDPEKKKAIYAKIDSVSLEASKFSIANEYDKMVSKIGAKGTNAFTSNERTVYINDIPSNELERWVRLERERFGSLVLRLFHTELEAVYEEFNRGKDNDGRQMYTALLDELFPTHPYGQQTTIGTSEHLKNPSMERIRVYWSTYYVPNNMAICLSGDFNPEEAIKLIDTYWGDLEPSENLPEHKFQQEVAFESPVVREVLGPDREMLMLGYRSGAVNTKSAMIADLATSMLSNGQAGLFDINLVQKQEVIQASAFTNNLKEAGMVMFQALPAPGKSLEQTKDLLLGEIEKIKKGDFPDWMLEAIINNYQLDELRSMESNSRAYSLMNAFTQNVPWIDEVSYLSDLEKITKEDVVAWANETFKNNYVVVYKRTGVDTNSVKVEKPAISSVELNRTAESDFFADFQSWDVDKIKPVFVDYEQELKQDKLGNQVTFSYLNNPSNELAKLIYITDMGSDNDKEMALAVKYLDYLGTDKYSAEEIKEKFYQLGLSTGVSSGSDRSYVYVSGLEKNIEEGIALLEHWLANAQPDSATYQAMVASILKNRADAKLNKNQILYGAMMNYAKYGDLSSFTNKLSKEELEAIHPAALTDKLKSFTTYEHQVFYYGTKSMSDAKAMIEANHNLPEELLPIPESVEIVEQETPNRVVVVDHDMVQAEVLLLSKNVAFDKNMIAPTRLFNEYFGGGMGSVVFQEIREAKGLAYTAFATLSAPQKKEESFYVMGYLGTQADKLIDATTELMRIMNNMPVAENQFEQAKSAIQSKIETERIIKDDVFWRFLSNQDRGLATDTRKQTYEYVQNASMGDLEQFFNDRIKGSSYVVMILGDKSTMNLDALAKFGEVSVVSKETIFGY